MGIVRRTGLFPHLSYLPSYWFPHWDIKLIKLSDSNLHAMYFLMFGSHYPILWGFSSHVTLKCSSDSELRLKYEHFDINIDLFRKSFALPVTFLMESCKRL